MASKIVESSIQRYDDKMDFIKQTASLGLGNDV
jgi:hypothetical protein